jgi:uncharacterized membrane protein (DUF485 family)
MIHIDYANSPTDTVGDEVSGRFNKRLGLNLFAAYLAVYAAYVLVNAFWPSLMDEVPFAGLNVAVISGLALIAGALALSLVYLGLCRSPGKTRL